LIKKHDDFLQHLPEFEQPFRAEFLADAEVVTASEFYPNAPAEYFVERLQQQSTEKVAGICPIRSRLFDQVCVDLLDQEVQVEVILLELLLNQKQTERPNPLDATNEASDLELYVYDGILDFGLAVTDENVYLGAYDHGRFALCMESGSPRVREWAQEIYSSYRKQTRPLTEDELTHLIA
jgi:predicted transcriptional regulator